MDEIIDIPEIEASVLEFQKAQIGLTEAPEGTSKFITVNLPGAQPVVDPTAPTDTDKARRLTIAMGITLVVMILLIIAISQFQKKALK